MGKNILDYNKACERIVEKGCIPLFTSEEWKGHTKNKKKLKYWFQGICGHPFYASYGNVASGHKLCCNACGKNNQLNKQKLSEIEYLEYNNLFETEKNITVLTKYIDYKNFRQKLECKCLTCNLIFNESIENITKKDSHGCFNIPKGERIAISLFEKNNIDYRYQVYISELNITSDFEIYLEDGKTIHLEIDGDQHYNFPNEFHKTYECFLKAQHRDVIKDEWYTKHNNINLHIRYNVGGKNNEDIEAILNNIIRGDYGTCSIKMSKSDSGLNIEQYRKRAQCKKIIVYTLDGNFHSIYSSILEAEAELGVDNSCISLCLNGRKRDGKTEKPQRAGNYMFRLYTDNYSETIPPYIDTYKGKAVCVFKENKLIEELKSENDVAKKYNMPLSSTHRYLNGKGGNPCKTGYDFKYK